MYRFKKFIKFILNNQTKKYVSISEKKARIDSFIYPKDDYDRVYFNYLCNNLGIDLFTLVLKNILGLLAETISLPIFLINNLISINKKHKVDAIYLITENRIGIKYSYEGKFPNELNNIYNNILTLKLGAFPELFNGFLSLDVFKIWVRFIIRHPFSGFINYRCLINLASYKRLIKIYSPKAIINARVEVNNMSSLVTYLCETNNCEYICFMHGSIKNDSLTAFVRFSKFYLWDKHYIKILDWARCDKKQYVLYEPEFIQYRKRHPDAKKCKKIVTYYFSGSTCTENDENAEKVIKLLENLTNKGFCCKVRPHPRWSDRNEILKLTQKSNVIFEDPLLVSINESLLKTNYCIGLYSTVLLEAIYTDNIVVVDDITAKEIYSNLITENFIVFFKEHILLSELLKESW